MSPHEHSRSGFAMAEPLEPRCMLSAGVVPHAASANSPLLASRTTSKAYAAPKQSSYRRAPAVVPGIIQAENYDRGGNTVAYYDVTNGNQGRKYRPKEGVDIIAAGDAGGGYAVSSTRKGEWMEYAIDVAITGIYDLSARAASLGSGGAFHIEVDDVRKTPKMMVPNTFGARTWTTITHSGVYLTQGQHLLRVLMDAPGYKGNVGNFNWISLSYTGMLAPSSPVIWGKSNAFIQIGWQDNTTNETGFKIERMKGLSWVWEPLAVTAPDTTWYVDSGLEPSTQYWYRVCATDGTRDSDWSPPFADTTDPLVVVPVFSDPIVITSGGTYSGNWESTNPDVPAVIIETSEPVIIENSLIRSVGNLIESLGAYASLTVRNTAGYALNPNRVDRHPGRFIDLESFVSLTAENNYMEGTSGIYVYDYRGNGSASQTVKILRNSALNIDGRYSDGNGGYLSGPGDYYNVSFFQINGVQDLAGVEIGWNQVINEPGRSRVEDNVSIFSSSGTAGSPLLIHNNYIQGAYPADPANDPDFAGGGILLSDVGSSFVRAFDNQVVATTNYGIGISSGHNNQFFNNRIVSSGLLPDGRPILAQNVGAYIWDFEADADQPAPPDFALNEGWGNLVGWMMDGERNDWWVPHAAGWINNVNWPGPITAATEANEYQLWLKKLTDYGVAVGTGTATPLAVPATPVSTLDTYGMAAAAPLPSSGALSAESPFALFSSQLIAADTWIRPAEEIGNIDSAERYTVLLGSAVYPPDEWRPG